MTANKKILVFASATYVYGAEKVTLEVIGFLQKAGHKIHCIVNGWNDGVFIEHLSKAKVPFSSVKLGWYYFSKIKWSLDSLVHYPKAAWQFTRLAKKENPDIVYVTSYRPVILLYPFFRANTIYHVHDSLSETKQGRFFIKIADKKIKHYIAVSTFVKNDLIKCGISSDKITVIYNGVGEHSDKKYSFRERQFAGETLRIGIIGQVIPRKGHETLVEALALIKGSFPFECFIFGSGKEEYIAKVKGLIAFHKLQDKIKWMGVVKEKQDMYNAIDVLVAPTKNNEPFALVALEAGYFGIPAIVTNSGGFTESIIDGQTGFVVSKDAPAEIADKLTRFRQSPSLINEMGKNARENITQNFSLTIMQDKITAFVNNFN
ncbi:MAG: glycosyltransferase family 4 protein [Bacteroidota bacterium]